MPAIRASNSPPRPVGRPRDITKVDSIIAASWKLFLLHGVERISVDRIATEAGVSKATVYSHFPDKYALFQAGVQREMAKIEESQQLSRTPPEGALLREVLLAFGEGIMRFLTSPNAVDFYGTLSGELRREPALAKLFYDAGPGRTLTNLAAILDGPLASDLNIPDARSAAEILLGMWQGMSGFQLMLGIEPETIAATLPSRVREGVDRFLKAYGHTARRPFPNDAK